MRILMVNHFPLEGSGSGTYTKNLAMQLASRGHSVSVVMPENRMDFPRYDGIALHPVMFTQAGRPSAEDALPFNFPCFTTHPASNTTFGSLDAAQTDAYLNAFRRAISEEIEQFAPDVIHGQHLWMLSAIASEHDVPLVVTVHGTDLMGCERWLHLRSYAEEAISACKKVICISEDNENQVLEMFPSQVHKVVRVANGYNPAIFSPVPINPAEVLASYGVRYTGEPIVLLAGKLTHFKGVDVLLDAAAIYEQEEPAPLTLIAGDGSLRQELEEQAQRLGLQNLHFLGNVSQEALCRLYNCAQLSVVPSRRKPFGLVALEALGCGTPVVATKEGGLVDFVNESVGALVAVEDAQALASAIVGVLERTRDHPEWRSFIAGYAQSSYSQEVLIDEMESLYRSAQM